MTKRHNTNAVSAALLYRVLSCAVLVFSFHIVLAEERSSTAARPPRLSPAESLGTTAGRLLGAAKLCAMESDRLQSIAKYAFAAIDQLATSEADRTSADRNMRDALGIGAADVKADRVTCESVRSALNSLERRLTQPR